MPTVVNPSVSGAGLEPVSIAQLLLEGAICTINFGDATTATVGYSTGATTSQALSGDMDTIKIKTNLANSYSLAGVRFTFAGHEHIVKANGDVHRDINPATGNGTVVGTMSNVTGEITLTSWPSAAAALVSNWRAVAGAPINGEATPYNTYGVTFRIATAPIKPSSFSLLGTMTDGTIINVTADSSGFINTSRVKGKVNYTTGVVRLVFVSPSAVGAGQSTTNIGYLGIPGVTNVYLDLVRQETLRYNAVAYTYLPLDADLLGIDPVRLPSDGRVPIFKAGGSLVVGHKASTTPATAVNTGTVDTGRTRLSRVRVVGNNGLTINAGYTYDLEAGTVTFTDVTGYSQPVHVEHWIEDMAQIRDAQIDGTLTLLRPLTHQFPVGSYVSSAFVAGDLIARTSLVFDQGSWDGVTYSDNIVGAAALASYNSTDHPIVVTNAGAVTERWVIRFTSTTAFQVIGEHLGLIITGSTGVTCAPVNSITGEPYFTLDYLGWGAGWAVGNILRFNTVGAQVPVWLVRTTKQGPETGDDYSFEVLARGDIDAP